MRRRRIALVLVVLSAAGAIVSMGLLAHTPLGEDPEPGPVLAPGPTAIREHPDRRIEINLSSQRLRAFEDDRLVLDLLVSSGPDTPTGTFRIWKKHRLKDMRVGLVMLGRYTTLTDVPFVMFYEGEGVPRERGFAIHGAYWHEEFGRPVSHGCINMRPDEARRLFGWTGPVLGDAEHVVATAENPGTRLVVHGTASVP